MWHRNIKWANNVREMVPTDLPQIFNLENNTVFVKWIKWGMPISKLWMEQPDLWVA